MKNNPLDAFTPLTLILILITMYSPIQLQAIKTFGDKTLSFGCWIQYGDAILQYSHEGASCHIFVNEKETGAVEKGKEEFIKILGHEPHLFPDVARVARSKGIGIIIDSERQNIECYYLSDNEYFMDLRYSPTIPLLDQPNLSEIVNLFYTP